MSSLRVNSVLLVSGVLFTGLVMTILSAWLPSRNYDAQKQEEWIGWPLVHTRLHVYYDTIPMGSESVEKKYVELGSPSFFGNVAGTVGDIIFYGGIFLLVWFVYASKLGVMGSRSNGVSHN